MTDWHSTPLDLNSMHEEPQLEEQTEDLKSIDEVGQLDDHFKDLNSIDQVGQLDDQTEKLVNSTSRSDIPEARMFVHIDKLTQRYVISKVVLEHSHPCYADHAEMLPQHRELSMYVRHVIVNNDQTRIRPSKTYQSLVTSAGGHHGLNFIEKDLRNYITREFRNVPEEDDGLDLHPYQKLDDGFKPYHT
ncbi:hypothetical protein PIB30_066485 [Stylosanthes scabra]|uniref:FAR1 domain-containing protein n=1 Tax=Stylosanthes scabra TaxID=79078 RepID=A0ABU6QN42_9FABA|nr:hypothetical protein [Stylosanthes scabra]